MIGWLYDLTTRRAERGELGERRAGLIGDLEGDVIEIGAGTGWNLPHYRRANRVVAIEPDPRMSSRLEPRKAAAHVPVELVRGRAESLPFPDGTFDAAVSTFVLCSVEDPAVALADVWRVLRPGATLVVLEHVRGHGRLGHWQDRLTGVHERLAGNCHLNRKTRDALAAAGFDVAGVEETRIPGHPLVRSGIQGRAIKTSS